MVPKQLLGKESFYLRYKKLGQTFDDSVAADYFHKSLSLGEGELCRNCQIYPDFVSLAMRCMYIGT
jgi:hypothetical protein